MADDLPSGAPTRSVPFTGRHAELRVLGELLATVRDGMSATLLLVGEAGVGKTRLLDELAGRSPDLRVLRIAGVESEARLGFAALHRLLRPFLAGLDGLPDPQREALAVALGLAAGRRADRYLVGLAVLTLLADASSEQPLLCLVDDVQWVDRDSRDALAFVARRLAAEAVGVVLARRGSASAPEAFEGVAVLPVAGLAEADAYALLRGAVTGRLGRAVAAQLVAETAGNPLALVETANALSPAHLAGTVPLLEPLPVGARLEEHFGRQVEALPEPTRAFLVLLSAAPPEDQVVLWRAAAGLGIPAEAADPALAAGLVVRKRFVEFRHPLIRSAVYRGADPAGLRRVHAALAAAIDPLRFPERRAWHRAAATVGLDEDVARELAAASERAGDRGGLAARAAYLARAAELSAADRSDLLVEAARAHLLLGSPATAQTMLEQAGPPPTGCDPVTRARWLHAQATADIYRARITGVLPLLLEASDAVAGTDGALARRMLLEGLLASLYGDRAAVPPQELGRAVLASPSMRGPLPMGLDLLLRGFALLMAGDRSGALPVLGSGLAAIGRPGDVLEHAVRPAVLALYAADETWDSTGLERTTGLIEAEQRTVGAWGALTLTLVVRATWEIRAGRFAAAAACLDEAEDLSAVTGQPSPGAAYRMELSAWSGRESETRAATGLLLRDWEQGHAHGALGDWARICLVVVELGLGRYTEAAAAARTALGRNGASTVARVLPDLVEASVRSGDHATAKEALRGLEDRAVPAGTPWALGVLARSRALMADDDQAEALFAESAALLGRTRMRVDLARTHLLHGEWLRRRRRRADARVELRTAYEMFAAMGADAFAERARNELLATGERARKRSFPADGRLTPQERRIAVLAAAGATNAEIAVRLFITRSTVEYHLSKVFRKLDITSRRALRELLGAGE